MSLEGDEVRRIPGTRGDALAAVLNLPSVARSPFDLGQLVIRGSAPGESGAFLLGMAIPQRVPLRRADLDVQLVPARALRSDPVELQRALRAPHRRHRRHRAARRASRDRIHGDLKMDLYDAHVIVEGSDRQGLVRAVAAAQLRRRRARACSSPAAPSPSRRATTTTRRSSTIPSPAASSSCSSSAPTTSWRSSTSTPPDADPSLAGTFGNAPVVPHAVRQLQEDRRPLGDRDHARRRAAALRRRRRRRRRASTSTSSRRTLRFEARQRLTPRFKLTYGSTSSPTTTGSRVDAPRRRPRRCRWGRSASVRQLSAAQPGLRGLARRSTCTPICRRIPERLLITPGVRADYLTGYEGIYVQPRLMARVRAGAASGGSRAAPACSTCTSRRPTPTRCSAIPSCAPSRRGTSPSASRRGRCRFIRALRLEVNLFYKDLRNIAVTSDAEHAARRPGRARALQRRRHRSRLRRRSAAQDRQRQARSTAGSPTRCSRASGATIRASRGGRSSTTRRTS